MKRLLTLGLVLSTMFFSSCGGSSENNSDSEGLTGEVIIDGSSTVYPLTEAVAEEFQLQNRGVKVKVSFSGTGGGFKKFLRGETHINNASRPIKESEKQAAAEKGIEYLEFEVGRDGITVVVNPQNDWVDYLTVDELRKIWAPESQGVITSWAQVREGFPDEKLSLYGPGTASGTFDFFTEAILGESGKSRGDYIASEDDNVLVQGVSGDKGGLGYFGYAYYEENKDKLKAVPIKADPESEPVLPTPETIRSGEYKPLSRPLYIYVRKDALKNPAVAEFVRFYLENVETLAPQVGFVPPAHETIERQLKELEHAIQEVQQNNAS
ncbi:MAG: PstS family phosphate ABC transporter substrate-binding protein [Chlorobi bacterium]|nr:PstS family phosphate ABC transporter substrate-binding protein [Chlorobiota bacterium]